MLSIILKKDINCVVVENIKPEHYTYAVANPNGWRDVKLFLNKVPDDFKTRNNRYGGDNFRQYCRIYKFEGKNQIPRQHTLKTDAYYRQMMSKQR